ncbi:MAG: biotin/lipoyl-containing protein, partial [Pseudomonadota bacterium]
MAAIEIKVPDIGDFTDVPVIEILVSPGDVVQPEDPLVTLESDKATMEVPAPQAGKVVEILVAVGDAVSEGSVILTLEAEGAAAEAPAPAAAAPAAEAPKQAAEPAAAPAPVNNDGATGKRPSLPPPVDFGNVHASPSVRMIA